MASIAAAVASSNTGAGGAGAVNTACAEEQRNGKERDG